MHVLSSTPHHIANILDLGTSSLTLYLQLKIGESCIVHDSNPKVKRNYHAIREMIEGGASIVLLYVDY